MIIHILLDSNLFIALKNINGISIYSQAVEKLQDGTKLHISVQIQNELKSFSQKEEKKILANVELHEISPYDIGQIRKKIAIPHPPRTADLSLLVIAQQQPDLAWVLVTDDFKLGEAARKLNPSYEIWTPSVFMFFLQKSVDDAFLKDQIQTLWHGVISQELDYARTESNIFPQK